MQEQKFLINKIKPKWVQNILKDKDKMFKEYKQRRSNWIFSIISSMKK